MHEIQVEILRKLLFAEKLRFAEIKPADMEGSQFTFHLEKLVEQKYVAKVANGYRLTESGKNFANRIDFDSPKPAQQAKHSAVFCATRKDATEVLIYKRLKNPYFGHYGFPTGKVRYGETMIDAATRELQEETNLVGTPYLVGIRHYRVYFPDAKTLVEDKVMYVYRIDEPEGELLSNEEGEFRWVSSKTVLEEFSPTLPEFAEMLEMITQSKSEIDFREVEHYPTSF
jgi:8-oxo-dGTP pyrophosphatase MutT (NUDIX family)